MKLKSILSAVLIAGVISARAVTSSSPTNAAPATDSMTALFGDPAVAKGKGFEIKRSDLDSVTSGIRAKAAASNQQLPADFEITVLNQLITIQLLSQTANAADRAAGQAESDSEYTNIVAHFSTHEAFERQLKMAGMSESELRTKAAQEATANAALKRQLNLNVTDAQVQTYFSNHTAAFEEPEKAHVRHILLMTIDPKDRSPLSTNTIAAKRKQIDDLQKRAAAGEDFAALASKYSEDTTSAANGGELPAFGRGDMVGEFESAAFSLKAGQVSDVVTTMYGFHVIKSIERTPARKYGLTDNIPQVDKTPAAICKLQIESEEIHKLAPAFVANLRKSSDVQILDPNLNALEQVIIDSSTNAPAGGDMNSNP